MKQGGPPRASTLELSCELAQAAVAAMPYGMPGPDLQDHCVECWGTTWRWLGNTWGLIHSRVEGSPWTISACHHECHQGETWLADGRMDAPMDAQTPDPIGEVPKEGFGPRPL